MRQSLTFIAARDVLSSGDARRIKIGCTLWKRVLKRRRSLDAARNMYTICVYIHTTCVQLTYNMHAQPHNMRTYCRHGADMKLPYVASWGGVGGAPSRWRPVGPTCPEALHETVGNLRLHSCWLTAPLTTAAPNRERVCSRIKKRTSHFGRFFDASTGLYVAIYSTL